MFLMPCLEPAHVEEELEEGEHRHHQVHLTHHPCQYQVGNTRKNAEDKQLTCTLLGFLRVQNMFNIFLNSVFTSLPGRRLEGSRNCLPIREEVKKLYTARVTT